MSMVLHVAPPSSMEVTGVETAKSGRLTFSDSVTGSSRMRLNHSWPLPPPSLSHKTTGVYLIAGAIANCLFRLPPGTRAFGGGQNHLPRASTALWANMCTSCPSTSIGPKLYSLMHSSGRSTFRKHGRPAWKARKCTCSQVAVLVYAWTPPHGSLDSRRHGVRGTAMSRLLGAPKSV